MFQSPDLLQSSVDQMLKVGEFWIPVLESASHDQIVNDIADAQRDGQFQVHHLRLVVIHLLFQVIDQNPCLMHHLQSRASA